MKNLFCNLFFVASCTALMVAALIFNFETSHAKISAQAQILTQKPTYLLAQNTGGAPNRDTRPDIPVYGVQAKKKKKSSDFEDQLPGRNEAPPIVSDLPPQPTQPSQTLPTKKAPSPGNSAGDALEDIVEETIQNKNQQNANGTSRPGEEAEGISAAPQSPEVLRSQDELPTTNSNLLSESEEAQGIQGTPSIEEETLGVGLPGQASPGTQTRTQRQRQQPPRQSPRQQSPPREAPYFDTEEIQLGGSGNEGGFDSSTDGQDGFVDEEPSEGRFSRPVYTETTPDRSRYENQTYRTMPEDIKRDGRVFRRYVEHPMAKRGLYKITADGSYLYRVKPSPRNAIGTIRFGLLTAPNLQNPDTGVSYDELYGGSNFMMLADYEWKLKGALRNFTLKIGSGLSISVGKGRLSSTGEESLEEFNFIMLPNRASLGYQLRIWDTQWIVPYVEGGVGGYLFNEIRDDGQPPLGRFGIGLNAQLVAGGAINLTRLDKTAAARLDSEYGINTIWFTMEFRQVIGFGNFDFTSSSIMGGVAVEF